MTIICSKCKKEYREMFDSVTRMDYAETGKGKPYEWHLCMKCRKELINWFKNK